MGGSDPAVGMGLAGVRAQSGERTRSFRGEGESRMSKLGSGEAAVDFRENDAEAFVRNIRVGVVTDTDEFAAEIAKCLYGTDHAVGSGFEVLYSVRSVDDLPFRAAELDVVVLDVALRDGFSIRRNIRVLGDFGIRVVAYAHDGNRHLLRTAVRAGALAVVSGAAAVEEFATTVRRAAETALETPGMALRHLGQFGGGRGDLGGGRVAELLPRRTADGRWASLESS